MRKLIPPFLKPLLRFLYYPQERVKVFKEPRIRKTQNKKIKAYDRSATKLIVFLVQGADYFTGIDKISGGTISIVSLCDETSKLKSIHQAETLLCTFPNEYLLERHTQFENNIEVFRYDQLENYFQKVKEILIHLPENKYNQFVRYWTEGKFNWLTTIPKTHVNILNQNIKLMPTPEELNKLGDLVNEITITTAHQQYCNQKFRDMFGVPLHKFSVWISPEKYDFKKFSDKEDLMIVSPDLNPEKEAILSKLAADAKITIQVIKNLRYEEYKMVISKAKWALTFGEGLDGYIIEPIFSGAIGFAVYNEEFFTPDFKSLKTIYGSISKMKTGIVSDILKLNKEIEFVNYQRSQFELCASHYDKKMYEQNIILFYRRQYTYL
jgi:hypothetical protein